jgi:hypothetical protein
LLIALLLPDADRRGLFCYLIEDRQFGSSEIDLPDSDLEDGEASGMFGFLYLLFAVVLSLCVVGLLVVALSAILGRLRDTWILKRGGDEPPRELH